MPGTPPTTTPDLLPRIGDADSPDIPRDMNALADATQVALNRRAGIFANAAARDEYFTAAPSEGTFVWLADKEYYTYFHDGLWVYVYASSIIRAEDVALTAGTIYVTQFTSANSQAADLTPMTWNATGILIPKSGVYLVQVGAAYLPAANSVFWMQVTRPGGLAVSLNFAGVASVQNQPGCTQIYYFNKGDRVGAQFACSSAATLLQANLAVSSFPIG